MRKTIEVRNLNKKSKNHAASLVERACKFNSDIFLQKDGMNINAKSLLGVMSINIQDGMILDIATEGEDSAQALESISDLLCK